MTSTWPEFDLGYQVSICRLRNCELRRRATPKAQHRVYFKKILSQPARPAGCKMPRTGIRIAPDSPEQGETAETPSYGSFVAYCFSLNYILGVGILSIPWGFVRAGLMLSPLVLVLVSIISFVTANWVLEAMARAQACFGPPADAHHRSESLEINSQSPAYQQLKVYQ